MMKVLPGELLDCVHVAYHMLAENSVHGGTLSPGYNRCYVVDSNNFKVMDINDREIGTIQLKRVPKHLVQKYDDALNGYVRYVSIEHNKAFWLDLPELYVLIVEFCDKLTTTSILTYDLVTADFDWFKSELAKLDQYQQWHQFMRESHKDFGLEEKDDEEDF